jgi:Phosphotransferase enzyme family
VLRHPVFGAIPLHSDDELRDLLGSQIVERIEVHAWPLSCVQCLQLADGRRLAYKSQLPPTVEPDFYAAASSPLLPGFRDLGAAGDARIMTLDWLDAPLLAPDDRLVEHGRALVGQISAIGGNPPAYVDIGSAAAWAGYVGTTLANRTRAVEAGWFTLTGPAEIERVRAWARTEPVLAAVEADPRITHGDLKADQVFVTADGYRVIDWQRPVLGPAEVDLASLLQCAGRNPGEAVAAPVVGIAWFLRLQWAIEGQLDLFGARRVPLLDGWAAQAAAGIG